MSIISKDVVNSIFLIFYLEHDSTSIQQIAKGLFDAFSDFTKEFNSSLDDLKEIYFVLDTNDLARAAQNEFYKRVVDQKIFIEKQITVQVIKNIKKAVTSNSTDKRSDWRLKTQSLTQIGE